MRWSLVCCLLLSMLPASLAQDSGCYLNYYYCTQESWPIFADAPPCFSETYYAGLCENNGFYTITGYQDFDMIQDCVACASSTQYKTDCSGYSAGSCATCSTAGANQYVQTVCTEFANTVIAECSAVLCGDGKFKTGCNTCTSYTTCTAGTYESTAPTSTADRVCSTNVACKLCLGREYIVGCIGASSGTCQLCSPCVGDTTPAGKCKADGYYDCVDFSSLIEVTGDMYISGNNGHYEGITTKQCTSCGENQLTLRECRVGGGGNDRICKTCYGQSASRANQSDMTSNCIGASYTECSYGQVTCKSCGTCSAGNYMPFCVGSFHSIATAITTERCISCVCNNDEYADFHICDGNGMIHDQETACKPCGPFYPQNVDTYVILPPTLYYDWTKKENEYCRFQCKAGYYKDERECKPCSILECDYGTFKTMCSDRTGNSKCEACSDKNCAIGEYHSLCPAGGTTNVMTVCTTCTEIDECGVGYQLASCATPGRIQDAECQSCNITIPDHGMRLGDCDWGCEEGYYKRTESIECLQCRQDCDDLHPSLGILIPCSGTQFQNAICGCQPGSHRYKQSDSDTQYCKTCTDYMYNDVISTTLHDCAVCPIGHQGNTEDTATHCEPCLENLFRNESTTQCEYCVAGTGGVQGMWHCPTCPVGSFATDMKLHVWLWNHAINPGWVEYDADSVPNCVENEMVYCTEDTELKWYPTLPQDIPYAMEKPMEEMRYQWNCASCGDSQSVYIR
ncbi:hypothetical protein T484DRAFT_1757579 [Baffinella frigidus]|nr:hypothetical protein T484DRAFT_1757579 [Cryptophyta sp. CCMP2293]